ncbi:MAG: PhzF family phenazine biosynthesis protein [Ilumatobacteraceae bacterium]|nr:PhzF family phenazine biosynthesis protein [Ilumatobacteraceae bacterium]
MIRRFAQVDVFASEPYSGNPLAVVVDAEGLEPAEMQRFARWTNLSETTFLLPPTDPRADYRVRIFTPTEELPFAGHPTLGSAHVWSSNGGVPASADVIVQECGVGLVKVRMTESGLAFAAPPLLRGGPVDDPTIDEIADSLGIERGAIVDAAWVDNGPGWIGVLLGSAAEVLAIRPREIRRSLGVVGAHEAGSKFAYEVRAFYSSGGVTVEDPVTGSLNASVAQWLIASGRHVPPYLASQGSVIGHAGVVQVSTDGSGGAYLASQGSVIGHAGVVQVSTDGSGGAWIGGTTMTRVSGTIEI